MPLTKLIADIRKGDRRSQTHFFYLYRKAMMMVCIRYLRSRHEAEEVMMDGFGTAYSKIQQLKNTSESGVKSWLQTIIARKCLECLKTKPRLTYVSDDDLEVEDLDEAPLEVMTEEEIIDLICALPDSQRTVFNLYVMEQMTHKQIAAELGIKISTSTTQLMKARSFIQQQLKSRGIIYGR